MTDAYAGSKGVGQIFTKVPQIMLCKPSTNDRWDRRVVELAAFMHRHGHCNVPEVLFPSVAALLVSRLHICRPDCTYVSHAVAHFYSTAHFQLQPIFTRRQRFSTYICVAMHKLLVTLACCVRHVC